VDDASSQSDQDEAEEIDLPYPEECRVLDIMRDKYHEAVRFFTDTNDKKQSALAVKEFQRFAYFYHEKMTKYLFFDPTDIEEDIYQRLSEETRSALCDRHLVRQIRAICRRRAEHILEDDEVNILNFQMFQYAMKIFQKEKKTQMKREEEAKKPPAPPQGEKTRSMSTTKLILINLVFFAVVAGGLMMISGRSLMDLLGIGYLATKSKDPESL
jgi:hypothetical protein